MLPTSSLRDEEVVGEKTPLLISVPVDVDANANAATTSTSTDPLTPTAVPVATPTSLSTPSTADPASSPSPSALRLPPRPIRTTTQQPPATLYTSSQTPPPLHPSKPSNNNNNTNSNSNSNASPFLQQKAQEIELLLAQPEINLWKLREFALTPGGLVNDTIRKRAWPKLVGLDHNYDPLPLKDILPSESSSSSSSQNPAVPVATPTTTAPTIEIDLDAQHELLQNVATSPQSKSRQGKNKNKSNNTTGDDLPPSSTLIVESMDAAQIDRDCARCTWHLLTGSQRSRRSQHKSITKNSTRGKAHGHGPLDTTTSTTTTSSRIPHKSKSKRLSAKYKRNRKVSVLLKKKQNRLANLINLTLVQSYDRSDGRFHNGKETTTTNPLPSLHRLRYYQGYHDVACIFLHALGGAANNSNNHKKRNRVYQHYSSGDLELPSKVLCQVSFSHFSDALQSDFLRLQTGLKLVLFPLLSKIDRQVHDHLLDADMEPFFCLSWILTWFSHDVRDTALVKRLFDAFLVAHPTLPVYAALAMMTHPYNRQMILDTDCDFAALHQCLASLPKHSCKVGYKEQKVEGFDNVVVYVSDDEGEEHPYGGGNDHETDTGTIHTGTESYLEEEQSMFDDADTRSNYSNYTSETIYTESSFPTSLADSSGPLDTADSLGGGLPVSVRKPATSIGGSLASGSFHDHPTDRTMISTEEPDFLSKESTLVSGKWDDLEGNTPAMAKPNADSHGEGGPRPSMAADAFLGDRNPVPFESVLETALQLIKNYPPSALVNLAKAYYQDDWDSQLSLLHGNDPHNQQPIVVEELIGLLRPAPPAWSILPTSTSDWMDKQKQRQDLGLSPTSRKDRRRRNQQKNRTSPQKTTIDNSVSSVERDHDVDKTTRTGNRTIDCGAPDDGNGEASANDTAAAAASTDEDAEAAPVDPMDYVRANPEDFVVAAIGYGPGMAEKLRQRKLLRQQRRRRKRRRALLIGCGIVVIGALAMYGGLVLVGTGDTDRIPDGDVDASGGGSSNNDNSQSTPHLRQLRSLDEAASKTESTEEDAVSKVASMIVPRLKATLEPTSAESSDSSLSSGNASSPSTASSSPSTLETSSVSRRQQAVRNNEHRSNKESSNVFHGAGRKTKVVLGKFARHLWTGSPFFQAAQLSKI